MFGVKWSLKGTKNNLTKSFYSIVVQLWTMRLQMNIVLLVLISR